MLDGSWPGWGIEQSCISAAAGLLGVFAGTFMTNRNQAKQRQLERIRDQLQNFYSPMLGFRLQIKAKSELRLELTSIARSAGPTANAEETAEFDKLLGYNSDQLKTEIIPLYRAMLEHFNQRLYLCESSTIAYHAKLVEFVEIWNRFLSETIPRSVLRNREHSETELHPFYLDLQDNFNKLSEKLRE